MASTALASHWSYLTVCQLDARQAGPQPRGSHALSLRSPPCPGSISPRTTSPPPSRTRKKVPPGRYRARTWNWCPSTFSAAVYLEQIEESGETHWTIQVTLQQGERWWPSGRGPVSLLPRFSTPPAGCAKRRCEQGVAQGLHPSVIVGHHRRARQQRVDDRFLHRFSGGGEQR